MERREQLTDAVPHQTLFLKQIAVFYMKNNSPIRILKLRDLILINLIVGFDLRAVHTMRLVSPTQDRTKEGNVLFKDTLFIRRLTYGKGPRR